MKSDSNVESSTSLVTAHVSSVIHWTPSNLLISQDAFQRLVEHAQRTSPKPCWGLVGGHGLNVEMVCPLDEAKFYCWGADPQTFDSIVKHHHTSDATILGFYHSHVSEIACPVVADLPSMSSWPISLHHIVVSLYERDAPSVHVFRREGMKFIEEKSLISPAVRRLLTESNGLPGRRHQQRLLQPPDLRQKAE
jgi:proteasome lid subunit RPN8/RPN11